MYCKTTVMRKLFTAVFILLACQLVSAQAGRFNLKGGANLFILRSANDKTKDYSYGRAGFVFGAGYELPLAKNFTVQPELNYSFQTAREEYFGGVMRLSYTQVPLMFRYHLPEVPFALYAGPQVSFLNTAKTKPDGGKESSIKGELNQTDFGLAFGIARVPLASGLTVDARAYLGVMNVYKAEYDNGLKTRPTVISVTVGYIFGKKK